jgi:chemotaxis signal transduction protein
MNQHTRQFCTFFVDDLFLGIDVQQIQEVIRYQAMTRVPLAAASISGLINLRGQIVTAIDLRCRLGLPLRKPGESPMNVVVRDGDNVISLLVDRIGDVLEVDDCRRVQIAAAITAGAGYGSSARRKRPSCRTGAAHRPLTNPRVCFLPLFTPTVHFWRAMS